MFRIEKVIQFLQKKTRKFNNRFTSNKTRYVEADKKLNDDITSNKKTNKWSIKRSSTNINERINERFDKWIWYS